jgi:hypothetical protein
VRLKVGIKLYGDTAALVAIEPQYDEKIAEYATTYWRNAEQQKRWLEPGGLRDQQVEQLRARGHQVEVF